MTSYCSDGNQEPFLLLHVCFPNDYIYRSFCMMTSRAHLFVFNQNAANISARQKRPEVWLCSTRIDDIVATCNTCKAPVSSKEQNTSNLQKYLLTQHAITLRQCQIFDNLTDVSNTKICQHFIE